MHNIPGLDTEVGFGSSQDSVPEWDGVINDEQADEDAEDQELSEDNRAELVGLLGFDPANPDDDDDESPVEPQIPPDTDAPTVAKLAGIKVKPKFGGTDGDDR